MKNNINKVLFILCAVCFFSCVGEEDDLFDKSSAERLNDAQSKYTENLYDAPNGWIMQYFATEDSPGYNFLMKFDKSGAVTIGADNEYTKGFKTEKSLFEVITDNGPVLSFNSYNTLLHHFSDPDPDGSGLLGDYEFVIMSMDQNKGNATLRGKKRNTSILMKELPEGASWEEYFVKLENINRSMFGYGDVPLTFRSGTDESLAKNGIKHLFSLQRSGEEEAFATNVPFVVTETGLRFHSPLERGGVTSQVFELSADQSSLVSAEDKNAVFTGPDVVVFLSESTSNWTMDHAAMSDNLKEAYALMEEGFKTAFAGKRNLEYVGFGLKSPGVRSFTIKATSTSLANFYLKEAITEDGKKIQLLTSDFTMDTNARNFYAKVPTIKVFLDLLNNTFSVSSSKPLSIIDISYKSNDQQTYFTITR